MRERNNLTEEFEYPLMVSISLLLPSLPPGSPVTLYFKHKVIRPALDTSIGAKVEEGSREQRKECNICRGKTQELSL